MLIKWYIYSLSIDTPLWGNYPAVVAYHEGHG